MLITLISQCAAGSEAAHVLRAKPHVHFAGFIKKYAKLKKCSVVPLGVTAVLLEPHHHTGRRPNEDAASPRRCIIATACLV